MHIPKLILALLFIITIVNSILVSASTLDSTSFGGKITIQSTSNNPPVQSNPNPSNGATDVSISLSQLSIDITDPDGDTFNWTIETSPNIGSSSGNNDNDGTKICNISGLQYSTTYTWYVNVTDGTDWTNQTYTFTTESSSISTLDTASYGGKAVIQSINNNPPTISNEYPTNDSTGFDLQPTCHIQVNDSDSNTMTIYWYENTTGNWILRQTNTSVTNGTYYWNYNQATGYNTKYWWKVSVNDSLYNTTVVYHFITTTNNSPELGTSSPSNGSTNQPLSLTWSIYISDPEGDTFNWTIKCSNGQSNSGNDDTNGTKTLSLSGLDYDTTYKVWVNATDGYSWTREWYTFTTREQYTPNLPTNFAVSNKGVTWINLTWTKDSKADTTYIERYRSQWWNYILLPGVELQLY